ncbi:hypothetical protein JXB12_00985 [candidate division KSB1 bacterium]|nr:hypothetical protein [candidate division KSB1 bacterium]
MNRQPGIATNGKIEQSQENEDNAQLVRFCNNLHYIYHDVFTDLKRLDSLNRKNQQISQLLARRLSKLTE